ncbi:MAG TPA: TonB family protein [Thermoanaerobaculia bacterium]|nr:TonB family protein [Thermoanaerobaculia bacterium]
MPSILVVEQDPRYLDPIQDALAAEGFKVRTVSSQAAALQAAASEAPDLVVVSTALPGMEAVASSFSRSAGGPGVVALLAEDAAESGTGAIEADELLSKPFSPEQLRQVVRRLLTTRREPPPPVKAVGAEHKLTSRDIFGDMLAEVESEVTGGPPKAPPRPAAPRPAPPRDDEMQRKLEQTLSGVLGAAAPPRRPTPPTPSPLQKKGDEADDDLDALISRTLSSLEMGRPAPAKPPTPVSPKPVSPAAAPPARPVPPAPPAPTPPAAVESTGVRKVQKPAGEIDFAELEELARPRRKPEGSRPAPLAPSPPAPSPPAPIPPPAAAPAPAPVAAAPAPPPAVLPVPPAAPVPVAAVPRPAPPPPPAPTPPPPVAPIPPLPDMATTQRIQVVEGQQPGERFGQYTLQEKIAVGGMAEVWKARMRGVEGFQKTVAIKKILPHLGDNADFVSMFIDEAKLAAQLSHPNIIHIYDLGKIGRDFYIAMEYVEGKDLRSILNAAKAKGMPLPMGLALLIAARLASALDYAHRKRDFDNREMGLVHRDVSPQNVLITFEGDIKLCDFGIAKAVSKANQTQMGALKGKLQYMSPEQAWGKPVDARSDLFSLGAILFEMLTGERLFPGDSEMSILEAVRDSRTRSARSVLPGVPAEVDQVVERALGRDPNDRFPNASEMQGRIESVLYALKPTPSHTDLAAYMHRLLSTDAVHEPLGPRVPELPPPPPLPLPEAPAYEVAELEPAPPEVPDVVALAPLGEVRVEEGERRGRTLLYAAILALVVAGLVLYFVFGRRGSRTAPPPPAPGASTQPAGGAPGAPLAAANPASSPNPAIPPAAPGAAAAPKTGKIDISGMVDQEVAKREGEIRKQLEEKKKQLEKELAQAKAAGKSTAPGATGAPPAPAAAPPPRPAAEMPAETARTVPEPPAASPAPPVAPPKAEEPAPPPPAAARPAPEPAAPAPPAAPVRTGDLVVGGPGVVPPELVSFLKPEYPPVARRMGVEGTPVVSVLVDENGRVVEAKLLTPIHQDVGINEAAVKAARGARYKPAVKDGVKVKMWTRVKIPFKL